VELKPEDLSGVGPLKAARSCHTRGFGVGGREFRTPHSDSTEKGGKQSQVKWGKERDPRQRLGYLSLPPVRLETGGRGLYSGEKHDRNFVGDQKTRRRLDDSSMKYHLVYAQFQEKEAIKQPNSPRSW